MRCHRNERGSILLLVLGFWLTLCAVAGIAVDGARFFILRRGLQQSADAAAVAAAGALDKSVYYSSGGTTRRLDVTAARTTARSVAHRRGLVARLVVHVEGHRVRTRATARLATSFLALVGIDELPVEVEASALPVFGR